MNLPSLQPTTDRHAETIIKAVITPEQALEWLEHRNLQNRRVNEAKVRQYAEEMRQGSWSLTHQPIAFDVRGVLIDGQHRLWAVVESDTTIESFVGLQFDPKIRIDVDIMTSRSITDQLQIQGKHGNVTHQHTACAKAMVRGMRQKLSFTPREVDRIFQRHGDAVRFAMEVLPKGSHRPGLVIAPVRAVLARAWYAVEEARLREFAKMLLSGIVTDPVYSAVVLLRNYLQDHSKTHNGPANVQKYARTQRALQACLDRQSLSVLRPLKKELFPLPEEAKA
jgi:hypothetical protein